MAYSLSNKRAKNRCKRTVRRKCGYMFFERHYSGLLTGTSTRPTQGCHFE